MKNSRGVTLASLVIMIVSIILLATMAVGFGHRYLTNTKEADENILKKYSLMQLQKEKVIIL